MWKNHEWLAEHSRLIVKIADHIAETGRDEVVSSRWPRWSVMLRFEYEGKDYALYYKNIWALTNNQAYLRARGRAVVQIIEDTNGS